MSRTSKIGYTNENTLICTLARMNPPTPGHLFVIRKMIEEAITHDVDHVYVILSKTNNDNNNPITCQMKKQVLGEGEYGVSNKMINSLKKKMINEASYKSKSSQIQNIAVNMICVPEGTKQTPFDQIYPIIKRLKGGVNIIVVVGKDREDMMYSISDFYLKMDEVNSVDGHAFSRSETEVPTTVTISKVSQEMSGNYVRKLVRNNDKETFKSVYSPYLDELNIENLYAKIKEGIESKSSPKSTSTTTRKRKKSPLPFPHIKSGGRRKSSRRS
jgi:hypothetical protein